MIKIKLWSHCRYKMLMTQLEVHEAGILKVKWRMVHYFLQKNMLCLAWMKLNIYISGRWKTILHILSKTEGTVLNLKLSLEDHSAYFFGKPCIFLHFCSLS